MLMSVINNSIRQSFASVARASTPFRALSTSPVEVLEQICDNFKNRGIVVYNKRNSAHIGTADKSFAKSATRALSSLFLLGLGGSVCCSPVPFDVPPPKDERRRSGPALRS